MQLSGTGFIRLVRYQDATSGTGFIRLMRYQDVTVWNRIYKIYETYEISGCNCLEQDL